MSAEEPGPSTTRYRKLTEAQITSISGAVSGFTATVAKQPVQRLKWIRQVDAGPAVPYNQVLQRQLAADGFFGLFRGSTAAIARNVPHSALVYSFFPFFERLVAQQLATPGGEPPKGSFATRFWAGDATLFAATLFTHPLDTLRVRISVTQGEARVVDVASKMYAQGGIRALYGGFGATLVGAGPRGAIGFGVFETLKQSGKDAELVRRHPASAKFIFGYLAGFLAEFFIYPLDTVRRRQQALGDSTPLNRMNPVRALGKLFAQEGIVGAYKGLSLNLIKNPMGTAVSFAVNDLVKDRLTRRQKDR